MESDIEDARKKTQKSDTREKVMKIRSAVDAEGMNDLPPGCSRSIRERLSDPGGSAHEDNLSLALGDRAVHQ